MLNQIFALTWKELKIFFKDFGAVALIFLQPFMFIVIMSTAMGGMFRSPQNQPVRILVVNADTGTLGGLAAQQLADTPALKSRPPGRASG